jgi:sugar phosphate isomerase/epimerase
MYLTGFADEAAPDIDGQIAATKALGWRHIESRNVDARNLVDLPDAAFDGVCRKLEAGGVRVNCFGSAIMNWSRSIADPFEATLEEVSRAIPRMKRLGTPLIRIMSYQVIPGRGPEDQEAGERFRRLREVVARFTAEGLTPVHENCMNYGGMGPAYTLRLVDNVPGLKLVFDTGNPVFSVDHTKPEPKPMQLAWEFYAQVKAHIAYFHVKDGVWDAAAKQARFTFPGEGDGDVRRIVTDALDAGYDGGISIEPHLAVVAHDPSVQATARAKVDAYVEYGRRMMALLAEIGHPCHV